MQIQRSFQTIELHTGGEPLRVITGGIPPVPGHTMLEKKEYFENHFDEARKILMHEPRGHAGMYGCVMTPPVNEDSDLGVLFMHNNGLSTMCGHGIIAAATAAVETGILFKKEFIFDTPAGQIKAQLESEETEVQSVAFENVCSFVYESAVEITILDTVLTADISFGGAFFAIVDTDHLGLQTTIENLSAFKELATVIKNQVESKLIIKHPIEEKLEGIYGVIFTGKSSNSGADSRSVTIFADEQIDRSPCGTGTSALMASMHSKGKLKANESFIHEGIAGTRMTGKIMEEAQIKGYQGIIPEIMGNARITGFNQFIVDPSDPLKDGFLIK